MKNTKYAIVGASALLLLVLSVPIVRPVSASPRSAGYDHGCSDASLSASEQYINQPGKGPSEHTAEFMDGYNEGLSACSSSNSGSDGGSSGSFGERHTTICGLGPGLLGGSGHPLLGLGLKAICSQ